MKITTQRGSGAGGQHRNVTDSAVRAVHIPTGTTVLIDGDRSQHVNKELALEVLTARVHALAEAGAMRARNGDRRAQIGSGERGDKVRTYRERDDAWTDHRTGTRGRLTDWLRGS